jgi:hypothetical protein
LGAEVLVFGFEVGYALADGCGELDDLLLGVARGDVLGAVPIEGFDVDDDGALDGAKLLPMGILGGLRVGIRFDGDVVDAGSLKNVERPKSQEDRILGV